MSFVHLHVHSHYSLLDGFGKPKDIVKAAKDYGCPAVALTDHGVMYGAIEFYKAAKDAGINPIIGLEAYVAPRSRFDKSAGTDTRPFHLTLLAKNYVGYQNLMLLVTKANLEGFYYKPRIDHGLLAAHKEGLIALSGCLAGELPRAIVDDDREKQKSIIETYIDMFGKDDYYLELQYHPEIDEQVIVNKRLKELAEEYGLQLVASTDSHYVCREDALAQDILVCIQTQSTLGDEDRMKFEGDFSLKSPEEMEKFFEDTPSAVANTLAIAEKCNIEIPFNQDLIPHFHTPNGEKAVDYLRELCFDGLKRRYGEKPEEKAVKQLEYELSVVDKMGFNDYFLIVWDFVKYAKDQGITVGPGRGSAAGSLITYCMDITELDPLKYGLIFERFLNPERVSMPDIDVDFADTRRDEVLDYVRDKYGRENVAQIITFGTMAARAAVRDVGRAMGYPYAEVDRIAKLVPPPVQGRHILLKQSLEEDPELRNVYNSEERSKQLLDNAVKLEGTVRHAGTHASAVVMSEEPLVKYMPLQKATGGSEEVITQYSMKPTEEIGLLKMDFLGLKNLTIIQRTLEILKKAKGLDIDLQNIPMDDTATYELLQKGETTGVFQLESSGMRRYIKELKPTAFEDIIAMISLYRPGPMEWIPGYIKAKHNPETIRYFHASFEPILKETNGVAIYQEQILQIARDFAGFSLGEADILRKAVGKKNPALLHEQKMKFIEGAVNKKHQSKFAEEVFEKVVEPFAGYGFNKAHAACYAMISYRTAYLKSHYPAEFMAALLSADAENTDKIVLEIMECEEMGISVLLPSINESYKDFTVVNENTIRFGLNAIKGLGAATTGGIIEARRKCGKFKSIEDFLQKVPFKLLNKKSIEALAYSGAMDEFGDRKTIAGSFEQMNSYAKTVQEISEQGQTNIFGAMDEGQSQSSSFSLKTGKISSDMEKLTWEKQYLGLFVSGHPLKGLKKYLGKKVNLIDTLARKDVGRRVTLGGLLTRVKKVFTKSGQYMVYGELEDPTGRIEIIAFPKVYAQFGHLFEEDRILITEGRLDARRGSLQFSCQSVKSVSLESMIENAKNSNLYDPKEKMIRKQKVMEAAHEPDLKFEEENHDEVIPAPAKIDEWRENPFIIEVPSTASAEKLKSLKQLLLENQGERAVELNIQGQRGGKRIKLSFGVALTEELKVAVDAILA
jgi:DNA polymerase-3 subunit alpha